MSETEGEMWRRLAANGSAVNWNALDGASGTHVELGAPVAKYGETYVWYGHDASLDIVPDPSTWQIIDWHPSEKEIRADERKLCAEALRVEAREHREYADRTRDDIYLSIADAYERAALMLERRHV